jgi:hypothetical protein
LVGAIARHSGQPTTDSRNAMGVQSFPCGCLSARLTVKFQFRDHLHG